ncbi:MAG TPA: hypothetical protein VEC13_00230 [Candidatus Paceibacterota bacterium]|nr:hypothetical protein [Candidatus Paceibacterota bacterium]
MVNFDREKFGEAEAAVEIKEGSVVVYSDPAGSEGFGAPEGNPDTALTQGKEYTVVTAENGKVTVMDDKGQNVTIDNYYFKTKE